MMTVPPAPGIFVQVGATRDGLDPYLREARQRAMTAVLVETPAYLALRRELGRAAFDRELGVADPSNAAEVCRALGDDASHVRLVLGGFERYNAAAHAIAHALGVTLVRDARHRAFLPPDKAAQRALLADRAPEVLQPGHLAVPLARAGELAQLIELRQLRYPLVLKPSDGGGGLGVFLVDGPEPLARALAQLATMTNYGGGAFSQLVAEEYIEGTEFSLQGVAFAGQATILTACEKLIVRERASLGLAGFREAAHIALPGAAAPDAFRVLAQRCLAATDYACGPFHLDFIRNSRGDHFVEMGYRLSGGGIVGLVERTTGLRWAALAFEAYLDQRAPADAGRRHGAVGLATLADDDELAYFRALRAAGEASELHELPAAPSVAPPDDPQLRSDRRRHGGFKGRVVVEASDPAVVRQRLATGLRARLERGTCVG